MGRPKNLVNWPAVKNAIRSQKRMQEHRPFLDRGLPDGPLIASIESGLTDALGGDPTPQQILLVQRVAVKALAVSQMERAYLEDGKALPPNYLAYTRELRMDLNTLGLDWVRGPKNDPLKAYLEDRYGNSKS